MVGSQNLASQPGRFSITTLWDLGAACRETVAVAPALMWTRAKSASRIAGDGTVELGVRMYSCAT